MEFFDDGRVEVERFVTTAKIEDEEMIRLLIGRQGRQDGSYESNPLQAETRCRAAPFGDVRTASSQLRGEADGEPFRG